MATPGKFVTLMAATLGLPAPTMVLYDRYLAEAGYRTKGARGVNAPHVTPRDAACLLTAALAASGEVKDIVGIIKRYQSTRPSRAPSSSGNYKKSGISELSRLPSDHSFMEGLEALFSAVVSGSLPESVIIEVAALTPGTVGDIRIAGLADRPGAHVRYGEASPWNEAEKPSERKIAAWEAKQKRRSEADLEVYRRVSARTIFKVGEALKPEDGGQ